MYNESLIKQVVLYKGWEEVLKIFKDAILESRLPKNFNTSGKTAEVIAIECAAREASAKLVEKCLNKINSIANKKTVEKEVWT